MIDFLRALLAFTVVIGVLVFFHELGHYLAARWRGVKIEAFSIGFGRALFSWTDRAGTVWKVCWLPLGGYVRMHGMEQPGEGAAEDRARWISGRTFHGKTVGSRAIIVAAGPIANFALAILLFTLLFALAGRPVAAPVVGQVVPHSAAAAAGLEPGDRITAIDGAAVHRFQGVQRLVEAHPGAAIRVDVLRAGKPLSLAVTLGTREAGGRKMGLLGISSGLTRLERLAPPAALLAGVRETWTVSRATLAGLWQIVSGTGGIGGIGGPLRIAELSGKVAALGISSLISFIAVLSINLGLINLFPIPILDGGHLVFFAAEALRGRPLSARAQEYGLRAGLALIVAIFALATWNDLGHLFPSLKHLIG